ncbi:AmmeMemoRadiSam system protein B [Candidatus Dojkabacteria bacterium]|nr:AmmeMemoRadiSam system protein B [Candidatus Dojkabacteria bacterium]
MQREPVRTTTFAGSFYPSNSKELDTLLSSFLKKTKPFSNPFKIKALIVPHAGYIYSAQVAAAGYKALESLNSDNSLPYNFWILGPSHQVVTDKIIVSTAKKWQSPLSSSTVSNKVFELLDEDMFVEDNEAHKREHSIEVQIPFIQEVMGKSKYEIIPLIIGDVDYQKAAKSIVNKMNNNDYLIVSSDLSHYMIEESATEIDQQTINHILSLDISAFERIGNACGKLPILILLEIARKNNWKPLLLKYDTSASSSGDYDHVVGYAAIAFISDEKS